MKENREALRAKILDGAISLFIEKGIEKVTTRELTEYVGISRSHIYHYFPDWQTLCVEALSVVMMAELKEFSAEISPLEPKAKLHTLVCNYLPIRRAISGSCMVRCGNWRRIMRLTPNWRG